MSKSKATRAIVFILVAGTLGLAAYTIKLSKAHSYLSKDPKACINCHVMNTQYATWQHSSHNKVTCIECHLPTDSFVEKYAAKAIDGWNHSLAFTLGTYDPAIKISDYGAERVQKNCISCHEQLTSQIGHNFHLNGHFQSLDSKGKQPQEEQRKCWSCHSSVPHGKVRSITTIPHNLGVKNVK
jgi:cytochrome c nitrite reductase small subunit